jgi:hypothetical protein
MNSYSIFIFWGMIRLEKKFRRTKKKAATRQVYILLDGYGSFSFQTEQYELTKNGIHCSSFLKIPLYRSKTAS